MPTRRFASVCLCVFLLSPAAGAAAAQTSDIIPPPPVPPAVVARDGEGHVTLRAVRVTESMNIDGRLDEAVYSEVLPITDFVQQEPNEGAPATDRTEAWVLFDDENLYVSARCFDEYPERMVISEMRRDHVNIFQNENFGFAIDTFYDRRNGFAFQTNPIGGLRDQLATDEGNPNTDWNTVWDSKGERFDGGWTVEIVVPFKSLRYAGSGPQVWGINLRRIVRWKNEVSFMTRIPATFGNLGIFKFSSAATLVGIETPPRSLNLEIKPYAISSLTTDRIGATPTENDLDGDVGFDLKYGVTEGLVADFTYNTDFAQVEVDEQQVNLTRFSQFFPEKREFFLEGQGIFVFGQGRRNFGGGTSNTPVLFFSRRIGLNRGQTVPIRAGGRLTGRAGPYSIGALAIQSGEQEASGAVPTNFSVLRLKRDILRRSNIGVIATRRDPTAVGDDDNLVVGLDAVLSFYENIDVNAYWAKSQTSDLDGNDSSYRTQFEYGGDRYGLQLEHLLVDRNFNPEIGFLRRTNFRRSFAQARFSPRPRNIRAIRKLWFEGSLDYTTNAEASIVETKEALGSFRIDFSTNDQFSLDYTRSYEFLAEPFEITPGVTIPVGGYRFQNVATSYVLGLQHRLSGRLSAGRGGFYDGDKTDAGFTGHYDITQRLAVEPGLSWNWIDLPQGKFTTRLVTTRVIFTVSPRTVLSALTQYNSSSKAVNTNLRFRWEYQPGSDLFVVFSEGRTTRLDGFPDLENRGLAVKFTRLFRL
ncbi:MAG: DUF5916 domain-containing protein [Vicinamibacterales bacterium]